MGDYRTHTSTIDFRRREVGSLRGAVDPDPMQQVRLVQGVLNALDGMLGAPIEERLTLVAARAAESVGAVASSVRQVDAETLRPAVAEAAEGSAFQVTVDTADEVEQVALREAGFTSTVVAGGYDPDARRWLVELFGDEFTHRTTSFAAILLVLTQAALGFPRAIAPTRSTP